MNMQIRFLLGSVETGKTKVTCQVGYHAPYPLLGAIIDRIYLQKEAERLAHLAIGGIKKMAEQDRVQSVDAEFEKRKADHPGYGTEPTKAVAVAGSGE